jgi:hypothetical protein
MQYKISRIHRILGTNPKKYIDNYYSHINQLLVGSRFFVKNLEIVDEHGFSIFSCSSISTLSQNIDCWFAFGFIYFDWNSKIGYIFKSNLTIDELYINAKFYLLIPQNDKKNKIFNDSIIHKLISQLPNNLSSNFAFFKISNNSSVSFEKIAKEIGPFERFLLSDKSYLGYIEDKIRRKEWV